MSVASSERVPLTILGAIVLSTFLPNIWATIAIPTDLRSMVRKADLVFTGKVVAQRSEWANVNNQKKIITLVTCEVLELYKGAAGRTVELRCPGGTVGDTTLELVGLPSFSIGEKCVLFVRTNANAVCPIVGIYHGKLLVSKSTAGSDEVVSRHNGRPLRAISEIGVDSDASAAGAGGSAGGGGAPLTFRELRTRIGEEVANDKASIQPAR